MPRFRSSGNESLYRYHPGTSKSNVFWQILRSPVETSTKKLDEKEKNVYQGKTKVILIVGIIVIVLMLIKGFYQGVISMSLSIIIEAFMQVIGLIDNKCRKQQFKLGG